MSSAGNGQGAARRRPSFGRAPEPVVEADPADIKVFPIIAGWPVLDLCQNLRRADSPYQNHANSDTGHVRPFFSFQNIAKRIGQTQVFSFRELTSSASISRQTKKR